MIERIIIAGAGGQGAMVFGKILAEAAMRQDKCVSWFPSYGAEVRGGSAYCMVTISDEEIGSPYIEKVDTLVVMNAPSLERFKFRVKDKGTIILNNSLIRKNIKTSAAVFAHPFSEMALELGNIKVANMIILGYFIGKNKLVRERDIRRAIRQMVPQDKQELIGINQKALSLGLALAKQKN